MNTKIKAAITEARIQAPTFDNVVFQPALVNFIYGRNGSGKTTMARAIQAGEGLTWAQDHPLSVYLYNNEYIQRNVTSYDGLDSVFSLSEANAGIQEQLAQKTAEKSEAEKALEQVEADAEKAKSDEVDETVMHQRTLWRMTAEIRQKFPDAFPTIGIVDFAEKLSKTEPKAYELETLESSYRGSFAKEIPVFDEYVKLPGDPPPAMDMMGIPIVGSNSAVFAAFWKVLGSMDWVREGHDKYQGLAGDKCPYCQQMLPHDFGQQLASCYDEKFRRDYHRLEDQAAKYREYASAVRETLSKNKENVYPGSIPIKYRQTASLLLEKLNSIELLIDRKLKSPSEELHMIDINLLLDELRGYTQRINIVIEHLISGRANLPKEQGWCRDQIWQHMAAICETEFLRHREAAEKQKRVTDQLEKKKSKLTGKVNTLGMEITRLNRSIVNTTEAMEAINQMLSNNGFVGFHLREKPGNLYQYELVRSTPTGAVIATGLSEGERHLIAFLYFYHQVMGSHDPNGGIEDKVVIIDDPVSSMDSSTLNTVAALTREMVAACLDANGRSKSPAANHIKQVFCLTHNPVFYKTISFSCLADYENCSFYEVRKDRQNRSFIVQCEETIREPKEHKVNVSPIINDYEYLWREYARTEDPVALLNVCRRILSAYFLQTCGHLEADLQSQLLDRNQDAFITEKDGISDRTAYNIASAMISLLDTGGNGVINGMYFDATACDTDQIRFVFHKIFEIMNSGQHYNYMRREVA